VTGAHASRWGGERVAAGVKRERGGAIVVTVDATEIGPSRSRRLSSRCWRRSPAGARRSRTPSSSTRTDGSRSATCRRTRRPPGRAGARPWGPARARVRDRRPPRGGRDGPPAPGMRLDNVRRVEQRMLSRLVASVARGGRPRGPRLRPRRPAPPLRRPQREARAGGGGAAPSRPPRRDGRARLDRGPRGPQPPERRRHDRPAPQARVPGRDAGGRRRRPELEELLSVMASETQRIDRIVQQFLEYARPPRLAPERVDLDALVRDVAERARSLAEARGVPSRWRPPRRGLPSSIPPSCGRPSTTSSATRSRRRRRAGGSRSPPAARTGGTSSRCGTPAAGSSPTTCRGSSTSTSRRRRTAPASASPSRSRS
jgi:hypothetical protein